MRILPWTILLILVVAAPAFAGPLVLNEDGTLGAYVDYVLPRDHILADWDPEGGKTVVFYTTEDGARFRGTFFPLAYHLGGNLQPDQLEIVEWTNDDTVLVAASFSASYIEGTEYYEVSVDGTTRFAGFANLTEEAREQIDPTCLEPDYEAEWDFREAALEIVAFREKLCSGTIPIDESVVTESILESFPAEEWDSMETYLGCQDPVMSIMPEDANRYFVSCVWHGYVFSYSEDGTIMLLEYSAPEDL